MALKSPQLLAKTIDIDKYAQDSDTMPLTGAIVVHAPPKAGKTFFAATASEFFPETLPAPRLTSLDDMLWIGFDAGAVDGFKEMNLKVKHIDAAQVLNDFGVPLGLVKLCDLIDKHAEGKKFKVADTTSAFGTLLDNYWGIKNDEQEKEDKFEMFRRILAGHRSFYTRMSKAPGQNLFLFHSKVDNDTAPGAAKKKAATYTAGEGAILPDIAGQGRKVYIGNASIEGTIQVKKGANGKLTRVFRAYPYGGFEAGNRFHLSLLDEEPANLRYILNKVNGVKGEVSNGAPHVVSE